MHNEMSMFTKTKTGIILSIRFHKKKLIFSTETLIILVIVFLAHYEKIW